MNPFTAWLKSMSTNTVWVDPSNVAKRIHGLFNPDSTPAGMSYAELVGNQALYDARYGLGSHAQKGNLVGERYSEDPVVIQIQKGLAGVPKDYILTQLDDFDICMLSYPQGADVSLFDAFFVKPVPVDPPVPPTPPVVPPAPPVKPGLKVPADVLETAAAMVSWVPVNQKARRTRLGKVAALVASIDTYKAKP